MSTLRRTYKYRLYRCDKRDKYLHRQIDVAASIWNHALGLQRRFYRLTGRYIRQTALKAHIAKLRRKNTRYASWKILDAQAVQDVVERLDRGFQRFFKRLAVRPPKFKKPEYYQSFTLKQSGWDLLDSGKQQYGKLRIGKHKYKFVKHREMDGTIKTVTIKRDSLNHLWVCFSVIEDIREPSHASTSQVAGFDFGLRTFLTDHLGITYVMPEYYKAGLKRMQALQRSRDRKSLGTNNRRKVAYLLRCMQRKVADQRRDYHFKLAHKLCDSYDVMFFETLSLQGMSHLWGRKIGDLGFGQFVRVLEHVACKRGKTVLHIGRWESTTSKCSSCGHLQSTLLHERTFHCGSCGISIDRDHNAAINILCIGASMHTSLGAVRPA